MTATSCKIRIALAEDHKLVREGFKALLAVEPCFELVGEASDGRQAVELVEKQKPDVLLLDLRIPRLHGIEVLRQLRDQNHTRIVVVSMYSDEPYLIEALKNGVSGYILKDCLGSELIQAIRTAAAGGQYLAESLRQKAVSATLKRLVPGVLGPAIDQARTPPPEEVLVETRMESDSMGEMAVPAHALYGAQTARAAQNFPISGLRFPREFIWAMGLIKKHAAFVNAELGVVPPPIASAIQLAAAEVQEGKWDTQFVVDIFQTGSGTSTNMNANEVIATRARELLNGQKVHPNDHVNQGLSSNDVIPTAIHLAALHAIWTKLTPALRELKKNLDEKTTQFWDILKIGRTHLQDATPIRLGQEFSGFASQVEHSLARLKNIEPHLGELALGGTAVGTGINTHPDFARQVITRIAEETALPVREATNHFEAQAAKDACVELSGTLKTIAISLVKIANDIRFLGSGPRLGYGELKLPATQPGSSVMPGKVNPVMCEMLMQVGAQVVGNDTSVTFAASHGNFELNVMMPVIAHNLLQSISLLANGSQVFARRCVAGLEANRERCESEVEQSLAMCTSLAPLIGYDKAAEIAKKAHQTGRTVREVAIEMSGLTPVQLNKALDPKTQVGG